MAPLTTNVEDREHSILNHLLWSTITAGYLNNLTVIYTIITIYTCLFIFLFYAVWYHCKLLHNNIVGLEKHVLTEQLTTNESKEATLVTNESGVTVTCPVQ